MKKAFFLIIPLLFAAYGFSQTTENMQEIFVTGLAVPTETTRAGVGITVISSEQIEAMKPNSFQEILKNVPGIIIKQKSSGKETTLYMRGSSGATMLLIDGMPLTDTVGINGEVDISSVPVDNIERIEVVKGALGASLGSAAMNGAINIITKKGGDKPVAASAEVQSSLWTLNFKGNAAIYGSKGIADYRISGSYAYDEGISAAGEKYGNPEKDPDAMGSASAYLNLKPIENLSTSFQINYADRESAIDSGGGYGGDNIDYTQRTRRVSAAWNTKYLFQDLWEPQLKLGYVYSDRTYGSYQALHDDTNDIFDGHSLHLDFQNNFYIADEFTLTVGADYEYNKIKTRTGTVFNDRDENSYAVYIQGTINLFDCWTTVAAIRGQAEGDTGFVPVFRLSTVYDIKKIDLQLKANVGTGAKAPSLYQLYDPLYGNTGLKLQESLSYEIGFSNALFDGILVYGASWFDNFYNNLISYGSYIDDNGIIHSNMFYNDGRSRTRGIEANIGIYPLKWIDITASYTWMRTFNSAGNPLSRRPEHQLQAGFLLKPITGLSIMAEVIYSGKSAATVYDNAAFNDAYVLLNASIGYDINDNIQIYVKGLNLTNTDYEEIAGYAMKGIEVFAGLKLKI